MVGTRCTVYGRGTMHRAPTLASDGRCYNQAQNLRYIDKLGRGIPMVCLEAKKIGFEPEFEKTGEEFQVTLPLLHKQ